MPFLKRDTGLFYKENILKDMMFVLHCIFFKIVKYLSLFMLLQLRHPGYTILIETVENRMARLLKLAGLNEALTPSLT
jgi:hypothetical protein